MFYFELIFLLVDEKGSETYDPLHRNPVYCRAEKSCAWELRKLQNHYHPSVSLFASNVLKVSSRHDAFLFLKKSVVHYIVQSSRFRFGQVKFCAYWSGRSQNLPPIFFFLNGLVTYYFCFWRTIVLLWGHWHPCFGFLVMSPQGFKARVGSALFTLSRGVHYTFPEIHLWWYALQTSWQ